MLQTSTPCATVITSLAVADVEVDPKFPCGSKPGYFVMVNKLDAEKDNSDVIHERSGKPFCW
ncbi:MAG: hypothetical protein V8R91_18590 [Butyricimonas faecihominis]